MYVIWSICRSQMHMYSASVTTSVSTSVTSPRRECDTPSFILVVLELMILLDQFPFACAVVHLEVAVICCVVVWTCGVDMWGGHVVWCGYEVWCGHVVWCGYEVWCGHVVWCGVDIWCRCEVTVM